MQDPTIHLNTVKAQLCKRSLYHFFLEFWEVIENDPLVEGWHIRFLCDRLQEVVQRVENREPSLGDVCINISPGSSKSTIASVMLPVWAWVRKPSLKLITGSHKASLSTKLNVKSRRILESDKFRTLFPEVQLTKDDNQKTQYSTEQGGFRVTATAGSSVIGVHADLIIVDDPLPTNNITDTAIEKANNWMTQELNQRKTNSEITPTILIMQRLAHNDPSAMMLQDPDTQHICIPAEVTDANKDQVKPQRLLEKYTEQDGVLYMNMDRHSPKILQKKKRGISLGTRGYANQYLQNPEPIDGGIIKESWIKTSTLTLDFLESLEEIDPHFFIDTAYTADKANDPSGILTVKKLNNVLYVMDAQEWWLEFPQLIKRIQEYVKTNGYNSQESKIYIEPKASGVSAVQTLIRETSLNVIQDKAPSESKDMRLQGISPVVESGRLRLLEGKWNDQYIAQLTSVRPVHDEFWDTTVMAVRNLLDTEEEEQEIWVTAGSV